ncbi:MAG TPA: bifunctional nuclease family protein [Acidimicrobiales bacterium]|nr:bifunctional nuclease family protein [Acidimicrobiales bacterium]
MRQVEIAGLGLEATSGAPLVVLRETDEPHRLLPIFVGATEAAAIGLALAGQAPTRPLAYDLMATLVETLGAHIDRVEVTELRDGAFFAELAVTGPAGDRRLDTRPSDAIALALRTHAPLFVSDAVLDDAGAVLPDTTDPIDPAAIDVEVAAFRSELEELDPEVFAADGEPEGEPEDSDDA